MNRAIRSTTGAARQRGAVLYIALIMLVLLAMLGIVGMQVTGLQERMAANYMRVNQAFQAAEASVRDTESMIGASVSATGTFSSDQEACAPVFDPLTWAETVTGEDSSHTRRIDKCFPSSSRRIGAKLNEETGNIYEISVVAGDDGSDSSSSAVISTTFIP